MASWGELSVPRSVGPSILQSAEPSNRRFSWPKFVLGFFSSIAAHEATHFATSFVVGATPSLGFDKGRPVVHSGIDGDLDPHKQFAFSSSGMGLQLLLNEAILWWPRAEGVAGEFERGILAGGIGTVLFYFTLGRNSPVGDVYWMDQTSSLSKWGLTAIFGGVAATEVLRIVLRKRYMPFFWFPGPDGSVNLGVSY
jgi:hypothetical protein